MIFVSLFSSKSVMSYFHCVCCVQLLIEALVSVIYLFSSISFDVLLSTLTPEQYQQGHHRLDYDETNSGTTQTSVLRRGAHRPFHHTRWGHWSWNFGDWIVWIPLYFPAFFVKLGPTLSIAMIALNFHQILHSTSLPQCFVAPWNLLFM